MGNPWFSDGFTVPVVRTLTYSGRAVRMLQRDGEPWWVLRDVCEVLGLSNSRMVAARLDDDEVSSAYITDALSRIQLTDIVSEAGLYNVILRSEKDAALRFRRWLTHEVLPSIRRTGSYAAPQGTELLALAVLEARRVIEAADARIADLEPRAAAADRIAMASGLKTLSEVGKINGIGPRRIFELLSARRIIYRLRGDWVPYQEHIEAKRFVVRETSVQDLGGDFHLHKQTYVTGKGELWLAHQLFPVPSGAVVEEGGAS